mmetsp:Transcript_1682/g.4900  ORF Transcript_1682/g.4900 Transcript_1682/m.4900 type:complete len:225 (+) Transcript_1682:111-785(+)
MRVICSSMKTTTMLATAVTATAATATPASNSTAKAPARLSTPTYSELTMAATRQVTAARKRVVPKRMNFTGSPPTRTRGSSHWVPEPRRVPSPRLARCLLELPPASAPLRSTVLCRLSLPSPVTITTEGALDDMDRGMTKIMHAEPSTSASTRESTMRPTEKVCTTTAPAQSRKVVARRAMRCWHQMALTPRDRPVVTTGLNHLVAWLGWLYARIAWRMRTRAT